MKQLGKSVQTEQLTEDAWLFSDIPNRPNRIGVPMTLILPKQAYGRFMHMIHEDKEIFRDIVSSLICGKLEDWVGKDAHVSEPEVVADIIQAALNKHKPLSEEENEKED